MSFRFLYLLILVAYMAFWPAIILGLVVSIVDQDAGLFTFCFVFVSLFMQSLGHRKKK